MTGRRRRKRKLENAGDAILAALGELGLTDQARRLVIWQAWPRVVGPEIANRTEPEGFSRGVLRVKASSAAWQNELTFHKQEIRDRLNKVLGPGLVKDIKVQSGTVRPREREAPIVPPRPDDREKALAARAASDIPDAEVRAAFESFMGKHLALRR